MSQLRIGEKIALGFGVVALIFLSVIWYDHASLRTVLGDYRSLLDVYGARQYQAFVIESRLNAMRGAEERFLNTRDPALAEEARRQGEELLDALGELARIDDISRAAAIELEGLTQVFLERFGAIEQAWRTKGLNENLGLQGAFRDSAHRLEERVARASPELQVQVLQLRRREKDYLLRGREDYVHMVEGIALVLRGAIASSAIAVEDQASLTRLVEGYERDFHALVEQDRQIGGLMIAMDQAVERITPLVRENLDQANRMMAEMRDLIARTSSARADRNLLIAAFATLLGVLFAVLLTVRIVRPVRDMAGMLDLLTHENPRERIPTTENPRDEIMAMAISLNTLADHKATFHHWWRSAMREAIALRDLHQVADAVEREAGLAELRSAVGAKLALIQGLRAQIAGYGEQVRRIAARLEGPHRKATRDDGADLRHAAERIQDLLTVLDEG